MDPFPHTLNTQCVINCRIFANLMLKKGIPVEFSFAFPLIWMSLCIFFIYLVAMPVSINHHLYIFPSFYWVYCVFLVSLWNLFTYYKISPFPAYGLQILGLICLLTFDLVNGGGFEDRFFFLCSHISVLSFMTSMFCVILRKLFPTPRL